MGDNKRYMIKDNVDDYGPGKTKICIYEDYTTAKYDRAIYMHSDDVTGYTSALDDFGYNEITEAEMKEIGLED